MPADPQNIYTRKAFHFTIISGAHLILFLVFTFIERTESNTAMDQVTSFLITLFAISVLSGFVLSLLSLKENSTKKRNVALIFNVGLFFLLILRVILLALQ
jgi:hypothetical protein